MNGITGLEVVIAFCVLVCVVIATCGLMGCDEKTPFKFEAGEKVQHVLDNRTGIITSRHHDFTGNVNIYYVRFSILMARTDVRLLGPDGTIKAEPYCEVKCQEFELKRVEK